MLGRAAAGLAIAWLTIAPAVTAQFHPVVAAVPIPRPPIAVPLRIDGENRHREHRPHNQKQQQQQQQRLPELYPIPPIVPTPPGTVPVSPSLKLRHIYHHGTYDYPTLHRKQSISPQSDGSTRVFLPAADGYPEVELSDLAVRQNKGSIERLVDRRPAVVDELVTLSRRSGGLQGASLLSADAWTVDEIWVPDVTDKDTVLNLAYISANAYVEREGDTNWEEVGGSYNRSADFGWESQGLRGHVWVDDDDTLVVVGLKGTSLAVFEGDGTSSNDKVNDNLFFSCCCAQQGPWSWRPVCRCATGPYTCNTTCVVDALHDEHRYYTAARELFNNVTELYPDANVWLVGHSLGGAVASLLGLTYGVPVVTFEAVPEALPARRLGLPVPPHANPDFPQERRLTSSWHFGHTADPIYMGVCNGATAACTYGGYALQSICHTGMECTYDVVADKGWRVGLGTHRIYRVIHDVIVPYDNVANCVYTPKCRDCGQWTFYDSNGTEPGLPTTTTTTTMTTTGATSSAKTRTRTVTCKTPGWWGCLDTTTAPGETSSQSSTATTSTCKTPGWFGCKDKPTPTTTTETLATLTSTAVVTKTETTTCATPGWWGCNDETFTNGPSSSSSLRYPTAEPSLTVVPSEPVETGVSTRTSTTGTTSTPTPTKPPGSKKCLRRTWLGRCMKWEDGTEEAGLRQEI